MKRLLLVLMISTATASPIHDDFRDKLVIYHQAYDNWLRKYIGCPPRNDNDVTGDRFEKVTCDPSMGGMDLALWKKARDAAKVLYSLKEKDE